MRNSGKLRMTALRRAILEEIRTVTTHPTAEEVCEMVRRRLSRASLGSVYRNLNLLCEAGLIGRADMVETQARFDPTPRNHYHVRCVRCGRMEDLSLGPERGIEEAGRGACEYEIIGHRLELIGVCPECQKESDRGDRP